MSGMKPIPFSGPMVLAILREVEPKTMTRRIAKFDFDDVYDAACFHGKWYETYGSSLIEVPDSIIKWYLNKAAKAQYQPGEIRYVKETWKVIALDDLTLTMVVQLKADNSTVTATFTSDERYINFRKFYYKNGWQSPYFFPIEAARAFIRINSVKVEKIRDITEDDARKEGVFKAGGWNADETEYGISYRGPFSRLWDELNKKRGYGWAENPYVFAYEFERVANPK